MYEIRGLHIVILIHINQHTPKEVPSMANEAPVHANANSSRIKQPSNTDSPMPPVRCEMHYNISSLPNTWCILHQLTIFLWNVTVHEAQAMRFFHEFPWKLACLVMVHSHRHNFFFRKFPRQFLELALLIWQIQIPFQCRRCGERTSVTHLFSLPEHLYGVMCTHKNCTKILNFILNKSVSIPSNSIIFHTWRKIFIVPNLNQQVETKEINEKKRN